MGLASSLGAIVYAWRQLRLSRRFCSRMIGVPTVEPLVIEPRILPLRGGITRAGGPARSWRAACTGSCTWTGALRWPSV